MHCDRYRHNVGPLMDGEISADERSATIAHLNVCARCAAEYQRLQDLRRRLLVARVPVPRSLVHRVRARIAREVVEVERRPQPGATAGAHVQAPAWFVRTRPWLRQAATILFACGLSVAGALSWSRIASERDMIKHDIVTAHVRSLLQGNSVQVASLDTHTVKPWFAGRLDFTPVVKDLSAADFHLTGGRIDYVAGRRVAVLIYTRRLHQISVFIWPDAREEAPGIAAPNGFNLVSWSHAGMSFWAISDLTEFELKELARLM